MSAVTGQEPRTLPAMHASTLCEAFQITAAAFPRLPAVRTPHDAVSASWGEYAVRVERAAAGLAGLGVGKGDTVGLMLTNRPEFHWCDTAVMHLGAIGFSIYNTSSPEQIEHIVRDAANRVLITERAFLEPVLAGTKRSPALEHVVVVDGEADAAMSLEELERLGEPTFDFQATWQAVEPDDVASLIYTSGTTGPPKGVQLTHANLMWEVRAFDSLYPAVEPGDRLASYLPMAHLAERSFSHYHAIARAGTVTCVDDPSTLLGALPDIRPTWFVGVPRVWEKFKAALELGADDRMRQALEASSASARLRLRGQPVPDPIATAMREAEADVLAPLRAGVGLDCVNVAVVGGAPIASDVVEFFAAVGLPLHEVWGLSESSAVVTVNHPADTRLGTVGKPFPGAEVRIAADGEILVRGPMVMRGYRNDPDATAAAIDDDGWLHTGDVGELDSDGFLRIIDRKKELIINAAGKNMSPANIEAQVKRHCKALAHAVAIGDRRPYNTALLVLDPAVVGSRDSRDPALRHELRQAVRRANASLSRVEQIKRFAVIDDDWQPGSAELTPTMKLRRKEIAARYEPIIDALYAPDVRPGVVDVS